MTHTAINELVRSFLQKDSLEECSVVELQQLTRNYPYASAAQLLLAEKLKAASATGAERQFEKTSLYFHGPLWQNQFTEGKGEAVITSTKKEPAPVIAESSDESPMLSTLAASEAEEEGGIPTLAAMSEEPIATAAETPVTKEIISREVISTPEHEIEIEITRVVESVEEPVLNAEEHVEETPIITEESPVETHTVDELAAALPAEEEQAAQPIIITEPEIHPDTPAYEEQPLQPTEEEIVTTTIQPIIGTVIAGETDQSSEPMKTEETHEQEPVSEVSGEIPGLKIEPIDPATAELSYTPFYTVDYFASQGIKFKEEQQPTDKFGRQLKSFTEWLKMLKKVPAVATTTATNPQSEKKVEQMAAHSLNEGDVLTEAMAEVWEKQDNPQKAIAIYEKLSLQNPGKRAYFAAKIDHLKNL